MFDLKGKPYQKVTYHGSPQQVLRDCCTDKFINSITISVKDENGEVFDFKGFPLSFELELNQISFYTKSSANVLPSVPPTDIENQLYPNLPSDNFQLTEISKIEKEISTEVEHYRLVLKKYKKARKAVAAALSSGAIAASLTGVGIVVGMPVARVAASTTLTILNKKLHRKVDKHSRTLHSLTITKRDSINSSVSQALNDNRVSDTEFQLITLEMQKYRQLKET